MTFSVQNILAKQADEPKLLDVYEIGDVIGKGAFGVVRSGKAKDSGTKIACKTISKAKLICREDVEDVQAEIAIMNHVAGHPHVVTVKTTHEDPNSVHIVMDLCEGGELFDSIVVAGSYSERKAAQTFQKMVDVVRHCHELGVMHRDLKPENFLLTNKSNNAELKLTDFGLGVFFKPGDRLGISLAALITLPLRFYARTTAMRPTCGVLV